MIEDGLIPSWESKHRSVYFWIDLNDSKGDGLSAWLSFCSGSHREWKHQSVYFLVVAHLIYSDHAFLWARLNFSFHEQEYIIFCIEEIKLNTLGFFAINFYWLFSQFDFKSF